MGNQHHTVIELNGRRYDARTGKMLPAHEKVTHNNKTFIKPVAASGTAIDGFSKKRVSSSSTHTSTTAHSVHKKTEKSRTLMRHAVKKPTAPKKAQAATTIKHRKPPVHLDIDPKRASRAEKVKKSGLITRFGDAKTFSTKPITTVLPVQPAPETPPTPLFGQHRSLSLDASGHNQLQRAIEGATSHKEPKHAKTTRRHKLSRKLHLSPKALNIGAASLAALLLIGFVSYQNVPNLSMRVATARAGVDGRLPGYNPSGFALSGPIKYQPGQITISYKSNSDDRQFQVSQRTSNWNSDTLLENYVAAEPRSYQTLQNSGKTIYIYDQDNATWVDGGVWYQIEGNASLTSDQLVRMAASM